MSYKGDGYDINTHVRQGEVDSYEIADNLNRDLWSDFVIRHEKGNIFQSPEMYEIYKNTENSEPVLVAAIKRDGEIAGVLLAVLQKNYRGLLGCLTSRAIVNGGPLAENNNPQIVSLLVEHLDRVVRKRAVYTQFRNFWDQKDERELFTDKGFKYEEHLNILVNLCKSEEELWKELAPKRRNAVKRAKKDGVTFSCLNGEYAVERSYEILRDVYNRAGLPLHDKSMFEAAYSILNPGGMIKIAGAVYKGETIGVMVLLCYKGRVYDWYAGSFHEHLKRLPNDMLPWDVFLWAKDNGYSVFDFGGAGKPGIPYGVRDYKKKFGGEFVNYGRYEKVNRKLLMKSGTLGFRLFKAIKKKRSE